MDEKRTKRYGEKIANLVKYINLLEKWLKESEQDELVRNSNYREIFALYHAAQLGIEVTTDLCAMMVKDLQFIPKDNYVNFEVLKREGIISGELHGALKELNGLRNRIVHDYNGIIDEIALQSISTNLINLKSFKEIVEKWLKKKSSSK